MYTVRHSVQHNSVSTKVQQYKEGMPFNYTLMPTVPYTKT